MLPRCPRSPLLLLVPVVVVGVVVLLTSQFRLHGRGSHGKAVLGDSASAPLRPLRSRRMSQQRRCRHNHRPHRANARREQQRQRTTEALQAAASPTPVSAPSPAAMLTESRAPTFSPASVSRMTLAMSSNVASSRICTRTMRTSCRLPLEDVSPVPRLLPTRRRCHVQVLQAAAQAQAQAW